MKALRFEDGRLRLADVPAPSREGEALVRVRLAGVCNTDLEIVRGYAGFRGTLGHEFVGVVESAPGAPELKGRRVGGEINAGCGTLVLKSTFHAVTELNAAPVVVDEISIVGSRCGRFAPALELLSRGAVDVDGLVHEEFPLAEGVRALERAAEPGV